MTARQQRRGAATMRRRRGGDDGATTRRRRCDDDATTMRRDDDATRRCGGGAGGRCSPQAPSQSLQVRRRCSPHGAPHSRFQPPSLCSSSRDPRGMVPALPGLRDSGERLRAAGRPALRGAPARGAAEAPLRGGLQRLRCHLPQELAEEGRHRPADPRVLRVAQGAPVHRELPRADAGLLRARRERALRRGLLRVSGPRFLLPKRKGRGLLRRGAAGPAQVSGREEGVLRPALSGLEGVAGNRGARALLDEEPAAGRGTSPGSRCATSIRRTPRLWRLG